MATWDVFYSDRLELTRGLTTAEVRDALGRGDLRDDDLIRPAGSTAWTRLVDMPPLADPEPLPVPPPAVAPTPPAAVDDPDFEDLERFIVADDDDPTEPDRLLTASFDDDEDDDENDDDPVPGADPGRGPSSLEMVMWDDGRDDDEDGEDYDPQEEDEAAAEFTLARGSAETVEELDLAAMVDVAFQLVLFFLVTATTVMFKSLEVPRPSPENNPAAAAQGHAKSLDDLKETNILVEIDPAGAVKVDGEPVPAETSALVERLRASRERTGRKSMLLSADFSTPHRSAVLAYDAANEIGLGIAIARPKPLKAGGP